MSSFPRSSVGVRYSVSSQRPDWELSDEKVPESVLHDEAAQLLKTILRLWANRKGNTFIGRNIAVRWDQKHPSHGIDPDVAVFSPAPPDPLGITSVRTWKEGYEPPKLAIEVVSHTHPNKDYQTAIEKYAVNGTGEVCIFDPNLDGPKMHGGPYRIQIWTRNAQGDLGRAYQGPGPAFSPYLNAWFVATNEGRFLRIAEDEAATRFWATGEEAALARVAELEAQLAKK
jgi:Uma2 family endonuclease